MKFSRLAGIARALADITGLPAPSEAELWANWVSPIPLPVMVEGPDARLWVDRYYAAYQPGTGDVKYVYLTPEHIREEQWAYLYARKRRGGEVRLPEDIRRAFDTALKDMRRRGVREWVDEDCVNLSGEGRYIPET